jgi:hypothetical protein
VLVRSVFNRTKPYQKVVGVFVRFSCAASFIPLSIMGLAAIEGLCFSCDAPAAWTRQKTRRGL